MTYEKEIILKDGRKCLLRHGTASDAAQVLDVFCRSHAETDFMRTYPEENTFTVEAEGAFLDGKAADPREVEICAIIDGRVVGTAGIDSFGRAEKTAHRAEFGIGILKEYWGLGIGRALTQACIDCARQAGYVQLELSVVAENDRAVGLYQSLGFSAFGCNPKGFRSRVTGWQPLMLMRLEL